MSDGKAAVLGFLVGVLVGLVYFVAGCTASDTEAVCQTKCRETAACQGKLSPSCHECVVECLTAAATPEADCVHGLCG